MKCERKECAKEAADGRLYCTKDCAQLDASPAVRAQNTESAPMASSSSKELGEVSGPALPVAKRGESVKGTPRPSVPIITATKPSSRQRKRATGTSLILPSERAAISAASSGQEKTGSEKMPKTESGTKRTSKQIEEKKGLVVAGENPTAGSTDLPSIIELEKSPSVSLIDDSVKQLHGLMKLIGDDVTKGQDAKEGIRPTDLAKADSVVRIATAMQKLIKTKVDAFKVVHR